MTIPLPEPETSRLAGRLVNMNVIMMLADAAQVSEGKLYILGGGWTYTGPGPSVMAVAGLISVPWDQANKVHKWTLSLLNTDGEPVLLPSPEGARPLSLEGDLEVGRPPGTVAGSEMMVPLAVNFGALPLPPNERLVWVMSVDGESQDNWRFAFNTRPSPSAPSS